MQNYQISSQDETFSASFTFNSGQVFRWRQAGEGNQSFVGVVSGSILKITNGFAICLGRTKTATDFTELISRYFSFDDHIDDILSSFPKDDLFLQKCVSEFPGLRLLTQDPWECLISFVCSINCNIPSIKLKIENLSRKYGEPIETDLGERFHSFPTPVALSKAEKRDLLSCKLGFRWKYVRFIARQVRKGNLDLEKIRELPYLNAINELVSEISGKTFGVGPKVADCVLLYSFHKKEAFPIDVWLMKYVKQIYKGNLKAVGGLTRKKYFETGDYMRNKFGKNAGYAQLFLYEKIRRGGLTQNIALA